MDERNWNDLWQNDGRSVVRCGKIFILEAVPWIEPLCDHWRERRLHPVQGFAGDQTLACEASVWHTHTRAHLATSCHILPCFSAWNLPHQVQHWTAAAILAEMGTKSLASGHCAIASVCLSISQSYYVLFIFYLFLSLSIHVLERTSCSILYFCQFHRTCPPRAMTSAWNWVQCMCTVHRSLHVLSEMSWDVLGHL